LFQPQDSSEKGAAHQQREAATSNSRGRTSYTSHDRLEEGRTTCNPHTTAWKRVAPHVTLTRSHSHTTHALQQQTKKAAPSRQYTNRRRPQQGEEPLTPKTKDDYDVLKGSRGFLFIV